MVVCHFALEKSFTLVKPEIFFKKQRASKARTVASMLCSLVLAMVVHIELWNLKAFYSMEIGLDLDCKNE